MFTRVPGFRPWATGGQVLLSQATRELIEVDVRDLGVHRLKDLSEPLRLFQLGERDFPSLRTLFRMKTAAPGIPLLGREHDLDPEAGLLFGRDRELGRVELCLEDMASGPTWLALEGEAGMGKTTVWRAGIRSAEARGYRVLIGGPVEAEAALSYAGLADLLAGVEEDVFAALPDPQRRAIDVALLRAEPEGRAPEPQAVFMAFTTILRLLAERTPVVLAVDDLQWLDGPSARALNFAVRRAPDLPVGILAAVRVQEDPAANEPGRGLLEGFDRLSIEPLDAASLHRLFKARLQRELSSSNASSTPSGVQRQSILRTRDRPGARSARCGRDRGGLAHPRRPA